MRTPKLRWGCLWRATLPCLSSGAALGGLYGALIGCALFASSALGNDYPRTTS